MLINIMKKIIKIFIFFQKYDCKSMIFFILELFLEKTGNIPIVQNVLINSKETSSEEIEAFFHRAILCSYNTLFVVGISDSFSNSQLNIIYDYTKKTIDKIKTKDYLDSCIIFIYDQKITNTSFLEKLQINFTEIPNVSSKNSFNLNKQIDKIDNLLDNHSKKIKESLWKNIKLITSDICSFGKSEKIKSMIREKKRISLFSFRRYVN